MIENLELKVGQRVICIIEGMLTLGATESASKSNRKLTEGKLYTINRVTISSDGNEYWVVSSDDGYKCGWVKPSYFKFLSEIREERLNSLGIW